MPYNIAHGWTDERIEALKNLWKDGLSASQIAKQLTGLSRNAVIGKAHRLGLTKRHGEHRQTPSAPHVTRPAPKAPPVARAPGQNNGLNIKAKRGALKIAGRGTVFEEAQAREPNVVVPFSDEQPGRLTIMEIRMGQCRWVCAPVDGVATYCAEPCEGSWCAAHKARVYAGIPTGRPRTAKELERSLRRYV